MKGLGLDLIEIERVDRSIKRYGQHFLSKLFTTKEQDYCLRFSYSAPHFAGRFAAKEAIVKSLGTGFGEKISWLDLEIQKSPTGRPEVLFSEKARQQFQNPQIILSITHNETTAAAVAVWTL